jgi:hypothetical protein
MCSIILCRLHGQCFDVYLYFTEDTSSTNSNLLKCCFWLQNTASMLMRAPHLMCVAAVALARLFFPCHSRVPHAEAVGHVPFHCRVQSEFRSCSSAAGHQRSAQTPSKIGLVHPRRNSSLQVALWCGFCDGGVFLTLRFPVPVVVLLLVMICACV